MLITALIFAAALAVSLGSYLMLSTNSLNLSHRTFLANSAVNLAETGLEESVWMFNTMGNSSNWTANSALWQSKGWATNTTIGDVYMRSMGSGYSTAPSVNISGGGGTGAVGVATIGTVYLTETTTATRVTGIKLTNSGTGYTSAPTVSLSGGGGTGAVAEARLSATRTLTFNNLEGGATGTVKVWVAGYNGTAVVPVIVAKASVKPASGQPVEKVVKVILSKNGALPKGVVAFNGITWNGHPLADSYLSTVSTSNPPLPPFSFYNENTARANTTVASLGGTINLGAQGDVNGNVMLGAGVTVTGGHISGLTIGNFTFPFTMPTAPTASYYNLGATVPPVLPRVTDVAIGGVYYYSVSGASPGTPAIIGATTVTAGAKIVIKGTNTQMASGLILSVNNATSAVATADIYIDGPVILAGNDKINGVASPNPNWAGSLQVFTTTANACSFSGNAKFYGCLTAPNSALVGNGGGSDGVDLCGSFIVKTVTSNGHMNFHYDEALGSLNPGRAWGLALWKEMQSLSDRAVYAEYLNF